MSAAHEISLNCLILGDGSNQMFKVTVQIAGMADVSDDNLKDLDIYQMSLPDDAELEEKLRHPTLNAPLRPLMKLSTCLVGVPEDHIHPRQTIAWCVCLALLKSLRLITLLSGVHTIRSLVGHNLQLNCLVLGDDPGRMFKVQIAETADHVSDLRTLIKQERANTFRDVDAVYLDIYQVSLPDDAELDETLRHPSLNAPLCPLTKLSTCLVDVPEDHVHILVKQCALCLALLGLFRLITLLSDVRKTPPQAGEQDDMLTALIGCGSFVVYSASH